MLTHINNSNQPTMVDITDKEVTKRVAIAKSTMKLPEEFREFNHLEEITLKKGPVFQTAIIAGIQALKKTHELIPFCHQVPIESSDIYIHMNHHLEVEIYCRVKTTYKTGIEMEALMGANIAAMTVFDMCKAISSKIILNESKLIYKSGGKTLFNQLPTYGLILTGGKSKRMKKDKALIKYHDKAQAAHLFDLASTVCDKTFLSMRANQWKGTELETYPSIVDQDCFDGPLQGIISAFNKHPYVNWIVLACDLPHINEKTLNILKSSFNPSKVASAYKNSHKGFPEALCAMYSPFAHDAFKKAHENDIQCPVKILMNNPVELIDLNFIHELDNINTPDELNKVVKHEIN